MKWSFEDEFNYYHLHLAMRHKDFTQKQLVQEIKYLSYNRLSKILKGDIQPTKAETLSFSNVLNFPPGFFFMILRFLIMKNLLFVFVKSMKQTIENEE